MFRPRYIYMFKTVANMCRKVTPVSRKIVKSISTSAIGISLASCEPNKFFDDTTNLFESLSHDFFIKQACTANVNAASQLITILMVAIQSMSERLRQSLNNEIWLLQQVVEMGEEAAPNEYWDMLIESRALINEARIYIRTVHEYVVYADKLATATAEISYLTGNEAASTAICERIEQAKRTCNAELELNAKLQREYLTLLKTAILQSPTLNDIYKDDKKNKDDPVKL